MKNFVCAATLLVVAGTASPSHAEIFPPTHFRCAADQLGGHPSWAATPAWADLRTGFGRTEWARKGASYWKNGMGDAAHGKRFWLTSFNLDVEDAATPPNDSDLYPVYGNVDTEDLWVGPGPSNATWNSSTRSGIAGLPVDGMYDLPARIAIQGLCEAGCYAPDQQIRVGDGSLSVVQAQASGERALTTLAPDSTLDSVKLMQNTIARWTVDIAPTSQTIITLKMKSGGQLRVTKEHPLVTNEGMLRQAQTLVVGDSLVRDNGAADPVVSISRADEFTKVYNLRPTTTDLTTNILVAQGYLSGSVRYQNEYLKYLNRVFIRQTIPVEKISRRAAN